MAAQSVSFLEQDGIVDILSSTVWDTSTIVSEKSIAGRILHTLVGYSDQPTLLQFIAYLGTLLAIHVETKIATRPRVASA